MMPMTRWFSMMVALLVLASGVSARAQEDVASPPDNAMIVGSTSTVTLRWAIGAAPYQVLLYAGNDLVAQSSTSKPFITLTLAPGPSYRWMVRSLGGGRSNDIVPLRAFQLSQTLDYGFDGAPGAAGGSARGGGADGGAGGSGQPGQSVQVLVEPARGLGAADLLRVGIQGNTHTSFYLLRTSTPVVIRANGGAGGAGGDGADGRPGAVQPLYDGNGHLTGWWPLQPTPGGSGGDGGAGGDGGTVSIQSSVPADASRLVQVQVNGGTGGGAGRGGRGGAGASGSGVLYGTGVYPPPVVGPAPAGRDGRPGRAGAVGRVMR